MIGILPALHSDELFYSICANYQDLIGARSFRVVDEDLFGKRTRSSPLAFPCRLDHLEKQLPQNISITAEQLIEGHTLLPFLRPFLTGKRAKEIAYGIKGDGIGLLLNRGFGLARMPQSLRYCSLCAATDREKYSAAYWHRIHQVPGIYVCPHHQVLLDEISPVIVNKGMCTSYLSAEHSIPLRHEVRSINQFDQWHLLQLWLADQVLWLLQNPCPVLNRERLVHFYRVQLMANGFERIDTRRVANFMRVLERMVSPEWIQELGWSPQITYNRVCWVHEVLLHGSGQTLKHLLIMRCLGVTIEEMVRRLGSELIFEPGPWPCLNPECEHNGKAVIQAYTLSASDDGLPNGTFACECGFAYRRRGPDREGNGRFRPPRIVATGTAWDLKLAEMWSDPTICTHRICRRLLVVESRLFNEAKRLLLPENKFRGAPSRDEERHSANNDYRDKNRAAFLMCLDTYPNATRSDLYRICGGPLDWLRKRDSEWLSEHFPKQRKAAVVPLEPYVDWEARDLQLATMVYSAHARLLKMSGRPIRITRTRLFKVIRISAYILKKDNLKNSRTALKSAVESDQSFALRQIRWFATQSPKAPTHVILRRARCRKEWFGDGKFCTAAKNVLLDLGMEANFLTDLNVQPRRVTGNHQGDGRRPRARARLRS